MTDDKARSAAQYGDDDESTPSVDLEDEELFCKLCGWFDDDKSASSEWRKEAEEDFGFVAGHQWTDQEKDVLKDQLRPCITFNRIQPVIDSVAGSEVNNRQEVRFIPREQGDVKPNELITSAGNWFRDQCDAEDEESDAFYDALVCGMGWTDTRLDFDDDPDGMPVVDRIDPLEMYYDCNARKRNLADSRRFARVKRMSLTEARAMFPDIEEDSKLDAKWADDSDANADQPHDADPPHYDEDGKLASDPDECMVNIVQMQWRERECFYRVAMKPPPMPLLPPPMAGGMAQGSAPTGAAQPPGNGAPVVGVTPTAGQPTEEPGLGAQPPVQQSAIPQPDKIIEFSESDWKAKKGAVDDLAKQLGTSYQATKQYRWGYRQAFLGAELLEVGPTPRFKPAEDGEKSPLYGRGFTIAAMTGKRDRNKSQWYGVVRMMKDPQRWANKWLSQALHILNTTAKGGIMAETGAFEDVKQAEESYARPDGITWLKNGGSTRVIPKPGAGMPQGFQQLMEFAIASVRDASGVNMEMLGIQDQQGNSGVLEYQRKQSAMVNLATLFDSLRRYRKIQGHIVLDYILNNLSDGRLVRIVGDDQAQYVPLVRQADNVKYDIIVDQHASSPNQKEMVFSMLMQLLPTIGPILTPDDWAILMEYSPLPTSLVEKFKASIESRQGQPDPEAQKEQAKAALEMQKAQMKAENDKQALQSKMALDVQKAQMDAQLSVQQAQMDTRHEMVQARADIVTQQQKTAAEIAMMQMKMQMEMKKHQLEMNAKLVENTMKVQQESQKHAQASQQADQSHQQGLEATKEQSKAKADAAKGKTEPKAEVAKAKTSEITFKRDPKTGKITGASVKH